MIQRFPVHFQQLLLRYICCVRHGVIVEEQHLANETISPFASILKPNLCLCSLPSPVPKNYGQPFSCRLWLSRGFLRLCSSTPYLHILIWGCNDAPMSHHRWRFYGKKLSPFSSKRVWSNWESCSFLIIIQQFWNSTN